jgi:hypothetical protein
MKFLDIINPLTIVTFLAKNTTSLLFTTVASFVAIFLIKKAITVGVGKLKLPVVVFLKFVIKGYDAEELVKSLVNWAEKSFPDKVGADKKAIVTKFVKQFAPWVKDNDVSTLIDHAVGEMNKLIGDVAKEI